MHFAPVQILVSACKIELLRRHFRECAGKCAHVRAVKEGSLISVSDRIIFQVVLYHDAMQGVVWRSEDEGKSWNFVDGVKKGSAWMLVEHPYDNRAVSVAVA